MLFLFLAFHGGHSTNTAFPTPSISEIGEGFLVYPPSVYSLLMHLSLLTEWDQIIRFSNDLTLPFADCNFLHRWDDIAETLQTPIFRQVIGLSSPFFSGLLPNLV